MDNPIFVDEETIPMVQDEDCDDFKTPNTSRTDETSFTEPDTTETISTLRLKQKVKRDKIVTAVPGLADTDQFMIKKFQKQATLTCFFSMVIIIRNSSLINVPMSF